MLRITPYKTSVWTGPSGPTVVTCLTAFNRSFLHPSSPIPLYVLSTYCFVTSLHTSSTNDCCSVMAHAGAVDNSTKRVSDSIAAIPARSSGFAGGGFHIFTGDFVLVLCCLGNENALVYWLLLVERDRAAIQRIRFLQRDALIVLRLH